jgi:hypothetical protein
MVFNNWLYFLKSNLQTLTLINEMTEETKQTPLFILIDSFTNFQHTWAEDDNMIVDDFVYDLADLVPV